jgi:hypothetical protein
MAPGENELAGRTSLINGNLDIRSELRQVLNLIDDAPTLMSIDESSWIFGDPSSLIRTLKVDEWQGRECHLA